MIIGTCTIALFVPMAHSLKDKRQVVRSVLGRVRNQFNVSITEVGDHDLWQSALLGVACVATDTRYARGQLDAVLRFIEDLRPDCSVTQHDVEML